MDDDAVLRVCGQFSAHFRPARCVSLGSAGGFSGASLWRVQSSAGEFCVRRWPHEHPSRERLEFIHAVLCHAADDGLAFVPAPLADRNGQTVIELQGSLWEVTRWMPGVADFHRRPSPARLAAAMRALAMMHRAFGKQASATLRTPPSLAERRELLEWLIAEGEERIRASLPRLAWRAFALRVQRIVDWFRQVAPIVQSRLRRAGSPALPIQPCARDIWHDHVLFTGDEVTGIIDFGAMRSDSRVFDVARLLGSLVGDDRDAWRSGLERYGQLLPLSAQEAGLLRLADATTVLLSAMNWARWICLDQRTFDDSDAVLAKLDGVLPRLERLARDRFNDES